MQLVQTPTVRTLLKTAVAAVAGQALLAACADPPPASHSHPGVSPAARMTTNAGTTFNFGPSDPKAPPTMGQLHYDVTVTGGTGRLAGAHGHGEINGAAMFVGPDGPHDADPTDDGFCEGD